MLAVLQFDAASARILGRLRGEDRLPNLAALEARGTRFDLEAPATMFAAGAQHTLYSGMELADHGLFYPFQWSAPDQRARYMADFYAPPSVWEQLAPTGSRTLAVDPYESRPPTVTPPGALVCGWQLHDRVVLRRWDSPTGVHRRLQQAFGRPQPVDEVFGRHSVKEMLRLRRRLLGAPARVADAATLLLGDGPYDLAWLTFCAAHVAGHQFWDLSQLDSAELDDGTERLLGSTLEDVYLAVDAALGRVVAALPEGTDLLIVSPVGMDVNTSRADLLPEMLRAILDPEHHAPDEAPSGSIWRLRGGGAERPPRQGGRDPAREGRARPHGAARGPGLRLEPHSGVRPPGREPGLHPPQPAGPRARRHRRPGRRARADGRARGGHRLLHRAGRSSGGPVRGPRRRPVRDGRPSPPAARSDRPLDRHPRHAARGPAVRALRHRPPPRRRQRPFGQPHRGRRVGHRRAGHLVARVARAASPASRTSPPPRWPSPAATRRSPPASRCSSAGR